MSNKYKCFKKHTLAAVLALLVSDVCADDETGLTLADAELGLTPLLLPFVSTDL